METFIALQLICPMTRVEVAEQYMFQIGSVLDHAKRRDDESHRMFEIVLEVDGCPVRQDIYLPIDGCLFHHPI